MADETPQDAEETPPEAPAEDQPVAEETQQAQAPAEESAAPAVETPAETPVAEEPAAAEAPVAETPAVETPAAEEQAPAEAAPLAAEAEQADEDEDDEEEEPAPRVKPEVPGLHLEVDIVPEGADPFGRDEPIDPYATDPYATEEEQQPEQQEEEQQEAPQPISSAAIDLAAGARYTATGKRKTAIARVILKPGAGSYLVNGRELEQYVPRATLQRNIRQPLETVGFHERMDVIARVHGGGIAAQAGALRHGIARALIDADPNLRGELKRRGFLTRDARVKERKKAGLKKARKRPQFSKR